MGQSETNGRVRQRQAEAVSDAADSAAVDPNCGELLPCLTLTVGLTTGDQCVKPYTR